MAQRSVGIFCKDKNIITIKYLNNLKVDAAKAKLCSLKQSGQFQFKVIFIVGTLLPTLHCCTVGQLVTSENEH